MGDRTGIEWTDATWNPTTGCDRVSPGCDHCYAMTLAKRLKAMGSPGYQNDGDPRTSGPGFALTLHPDRLDQPLRWTRPRRIFVNSMSDLFHKDVSYNYIAEVFAVMAMAQQHTFQVLTKRTSGMERLLRNPEFTRELLRAYELRAGTPAADIVGLTPWTGLPNVWLGTSIESDRYTFRADYLRRMPAAMRFLSCEPLLGPLPSLDLTDIDWVIVGGESGPGARPMHPDWVRNIRDQCVAAGVAFLFKQWGEWTPYQTLECYRRTEPYVMVTGGPDHDDAWMWRAGKHRAGRKLDRLEWDEYPS